VEKFLKILIVLVIGVLGLRFLAAHQRVAARTAAATPAAADPSIGPDTAPAKPSRPVTPPSRFGFSELPEPYVGPSDRLMVFASPTCPRAENQRALNLVKVLNMEGLPCVSSSKISFQMLREPTPAESARLDAIMTGAVPLVFINGKVSNNPSLAEIEGEYQATR